MPHGFRAERCAGAPFGGAARSGTSSVRLPADGLPRFAAFCPPLASVADPCHAANSCLLMLRGPMQGPPSPHAQPHKASSGPDDRVRGQGPAAARPPPAGAATKVAAWQRGALALLVGLVHPLPALLSIRWSLLPRSRGLPCVLELWSDAPGERQTRRTGWWLAEPRRVRGGGQRARRPSRARARRSPACCWPGRCGRGAAPRTCSSSTAGAPARACAPARRCVSETARRSRRRAGPCPQPCAHG